MSALALPAAGGEEAEPAFRIVSCDAGTVRRVDEARLHLSQERWHEGCRALQAFIDERVDSLYPIGTGRYQGIQTYVRELLKRLPPAGRKAYLSLYGREAAALYRSAVRKSDAGSVREVARRFPVAPESEQALRYLESLEVPGDSAGATDLEDVVPFSGATGKGLEGSWDRPAWIHAVRVPSSSSDLIRVCRGDGTWFVSAGDYVCAIDHASGRRLWEYSSPVPLDETCAEQEDTPLSWLFSPAAARGAVFVSVPVEPARVDGDAFGQPALYEQPRFDLIALNQKTGQRLWSARDALRRTDPSLGESLSWNGPPLVQGNRVYATGMTFRGGFNCWVACLDADRGDFLWKVFLCGGQREMNLAGYPLDSAVASPPVLRDGKLYVCTHLGAVVCLDAREGGVEWLAEYETSQELQGWCNQPPVMAGGVLCAAPMDSPHVYGWDAHTGEALWRRTGKAADRYLTPAGGEAVLLASPRRGLLLEPRSGVVVREMPFKGGSLASAPCDVGTLLAVRTSNGEGALYDVASGRPVSCGKLGMQWAGPLSLWGPWLVIPDRSGLRGWFLPSLREAAGTIPPADFK